MQFLLKFFYLLLFSFFLDENKIDEGSFLNNSNSSESTINNQEVNSNSHTYWQNKTCIVAGCLFILSACMFSFYYYNIPPATDPTIYWNSLKDNLASTVDVIKFLSEKNLYIFNSLNLPETLPLRPSGFNHTRLDIPDDYKFFLLKKAKSLGMVYVIRLFKSHLTGIRYPLKKVAILIPEECVNKKTDIILNIS